MIIIIINVSNSLEQNGLLWIPASDHQHHGILDLLQSDLAHQMPLIIGLAGFKDKQILCLKKQICAPCPSPHAAP